MNNATLLTADRSTHVKIVMMALVASIAVVLIRSAVHVKPVGSEPFLRITAHVVVGGS